MADLSVTRTEIAVWGVMLRGHARLLLGDRNRSARMMGVDLVRLADRFDPSHRDIQMSDRAQKELFIVNQLDAADKEIERLEAENASLRDALTQAHAAGTLDADDVSAIAAMEAEIAKRTPAPDAPPAPPVVADDPVLR